MRYLLLLAVLLLISCAPPDPYSTRVTGRDLQGPFDRAASRLEAASGIQLYRGPEPSIDVRWGQGECRSGDWACTTTVRRKGLPDLRRVRMLEASRQHLEGTLLHELMHALGARHVDSVAVMYPHPDFQSDCITPEDLTSLCAAADCTHFTPECEKGKTWYQNTSQ